jgi:hypothetical protein
MTRAVEIPCTDILRTFHSISAFSGIFFKTFFFDVQVHILVKINNLEVPILSWSSKISKWKIKVSAWRELVVY